MKLLSSIALIALLAGCAEQPALQSGAAALSGASQMPRGIQRTDGHGPVLVSAAGEARCAGLTAAESGYALKHTNAVRAAAGLAPLRLNPKLQKAAAQQACDMASRGVMEHRGTRSTGPGMRVKQLGYQPRITAENIAAGSSSLFDLEGTMRELASSGRHRANTVIPQLRDMGIGRAMSPDGRVTYWSVVYSAPK